MKDLLVRWITRWDREAVAELLAANALEHGFETAPDDLKEAFEFALREPDQVRFCVAVRDGEVLGTACLNRAYSTWRGKAFGTIEDVYVREEARREGIALSLLQFLLAEAVRRGYACLSLRVRSGNVAARELYEKFGMTEAGCAVYEMDFDEPAG